MNTITLSVLVMGITGAAFGLLLSFLNKRLAVREDPRVKQILETLPGLNCGACGFSGCRAYAEAVVQKPENFRACLPGGEKTNNGVRRILGIRAPSAGNEKNTTAVCACGAEYGEKLRSTDYCGPRNCAAAALIRGYVDCQSGCIGFGDCVEVCPADALTLRNGKIHVNHQRCISCGNCLRTCPRNLFRIVPLNHAVCYVGCNNRESGPDTRKVCTRGCIACGLCARVPDSPYSLKENLSNLKYAPDSASAQYAGKEKCPTKCIWTISTDQT
ncbi:MAG: RnfABCDGE type electron transport complex subunit B [Candidatus Omnitrophica bacterium]|nr:RnfABCDGE type electron transport complex subunit B [Candidatus Omnitrophota bacterium]